MPGEATIPLNLPDFNGTPAPDGRGQHARQLASADTEMVVAAPLVAELNMPRFIAPATAPPSPWM